MSDKKETSKRPTPKGKPIGGRSWTSTSTPELDDEFLDLTISLRFSIERSRR